MARELRGCSRSVGQSCSTRAALLWVNSQHRNQISRELEAHVRILSSPQALLKGVGADSSTCLIVVRCLAKPPCCRRALRKLLQHMNERHERTVHPTHTSGRGGHATLPTRLDQGMDAWNTLCGAHFSSKVNAHKLASLFRVSPRHLRRLFKKAGWQPPVRRFQISQLTKAYQDLRSGTPSIEELTAELGFSERSAFSRAFTRLFGISPGRVRRLPRSTKVDSV
jgi:AraC-like DNA-binding protein